MKLVSAPGYYYCCYAVAFTLVIACASNINRSTPKSIATPSTGITFVAARELLKPYEV
ncbi:hypothetical protein SNE26_28480 [Mucilaginibacter sp. cycad4]|uniref:hypothetical protein n=1 Tax=Mucilaginibacter sp. cycad4 TaxID=3342096 RepID=UPI002AAA6A54|nr:hypothetical protein [Mucilaginibacter gossypii]WPU99950.1 hypothetical protein SNE26_28480 [Mucilaginibacter gossypii]